MPRSFLANPVLWSAYETDLFFIVMGGSLSTVAM